MQRLRGQEGDQEMYKIQFNMNLFLYLLGGAQQINANEQLLISFINN